MRQGRENRGGTRDGAGRKLGVPQPHLRGPNPRHNRLSVSINDRELDKLERLCVSKGVPIATLLYEFAKKGGL